MADLTRLVRQQSSEIVALKQRLDALQEMLSLRLQDPTAAFRLERTAFAAKP